MNKYVFGALLGLAACGGTAEEYQQIAEQGYVSDAGDLGQTEQAITIPNYPHGYVAEQLAPSTRTCDTTVPGNVCVYPASKTVRVCVDTTGMTDAERTLGAPVLGRVLTRLNSRMLTSGFGEGYRYVGVQCSDPLRTLVFSKTSFTGGLINKYVTMGCDLPGASFPIVNIPPPPVTGKLCSRIHGYINYANVAADFGTPVLGQVNGTWDIVMDRLFGHVAVTGSTGIGSQVVADTLYSWGGGIINGGQPGTFSAVPVATAGGLNGVASFERCRAQRYNPAGAGVAINPGVCSPL